MSVLPANAQTSAAMLNAASENWSVIRPRFEMKSGVMNSFASPAPQNDFGRAVVRGTTAVFQRRTTVVPTARIRFPLRRALLILEAASGEISTARRA